jgi:thioredoxin reductase (NADPH)
MPSMNDEKQSQNIPLDVLILGGGPAGMAAGIYAGRNRLRALVIDSMGGGGQLNIIDKVENYPGFEAKSGVELADAMRKQMDSFGAQFAFEQAEAIEIGSDSVTIRASSIYQAKALIVASGATHRNLNVPGERKLLGRGVSYCATCDGAFFKGRRVTVVGGGNTAAQEAIYLSRIVEHVTLIHRRDRLRAERFLQERLLSAGNVDIQYNTVVEEILGDTEVRGLKLRDTKTNATRELSAAAVFVFAGTLPNTEFLKGVVSLDESGFIKTDLCMRTSHPRIFAAGDVRSDSPRQIGAAVGDGITAAISVQTLLDETMPPRA